MHKDSVFVAASEKERCLLPTAAASVGLSVHTSMQTSSAWQQKAASVTYPSKAFFRVIPVADAQVGNFTEVPHTQNPPEMEDD